VIVTDVEPDGIVNAPDGVAVPLTAPGQPAPYVCPEIGTATATTGAVVSYTNVDAEFVTVLPAESMVRSVTL
jgi:hypothetical protein